MENILKNKKTVFIVISIILLLLIVIGVIVSNSFKRNNSNEEIITKHLELIGNSDIVVYQDNIYTDPGFIAYDSKGNDLSKDVVINDNINTAIVGEYYISYTLDDIYLERKINVISNTKQLTFLLLQGEYVIYQKVGSIYNEPGYIVIDNIDSNLKDKVTIKGNVDTSKAGTYKLVYSVTNSSGITISSERTVIITDFSLTLSLDSNKPTKKSVNINIIVNDNYFDYVLLPDGTKKSDRNFKYNVTDNGKYNFKLYSNDNTFTEKSITVNNIDKEKPKLTCTVYLYDNNSKIVANAKDDIRITNYVYTYGSTTSGKTDKSSLTYNVKTSDTSVTVYDAVSNSTTSKCNVIDSSTKYGRSYSQASGAYPYWIYIPPTLTKRTTVPLVIFLHGSSEQGSNMELVNRHGFPKFVKGGTDYPFIMVAPQTKSGWDSSKVIQLANEIINKYPEIDQRRIVLTGFSMGGNGTFTTVKNNPDYFSLAVPVAGSVNYSTNFNKTVFRIYFGSKDSESGLNTCRNTIKKISAANPKSQLIVLDGKSHVGSAEAAYSDPALIEAIVNTYK